MTGRERHRLSGVAQIFPGENRLSDESLNRFVTEKLAEPALDLFKANYTERLREFKQTCESRGLELTI